MISGMISQYFSYTWIHFWIHRVMKCSIWIHDHEILYEFINWIDIWIHDHELGRTSWSHMYEFIYGFKPLNLWSWNHVMNSCVNSVQWRILWYHGWIPFTYEIMVDFVKLNIPDSASIYFSEGKCVLLIQSNHLSFVAVSSLQALRLLHGCCCVAAGRRCCDSRCAAHSRAGKTWRDFYAHDGRHLRRVLLACLSAIKETL